MFTKPGHLRGDWRTSGRLTRQYLLHIKRARREGLMTRSSDPNLSPCRDHGVVFLGKALFSPYKPQCKPSSATRVNIFMFY